MAEGDCPCIVCRTNRASKAAEERRKAPRTYPYIGFLPAGDSNEGSFKVRFTSPNTGQVVWSLNKERPLGYSTDQWVEYQFTPEPGMTWPGNVQSILRDAARLWGPRFVAADFTPEQSVILAYEVAGDGQIRVFDWFTETAPIDPEVLEDLLADSEAMAPLEEFVATVAKFNEKEVADAAEKLVAEQEVAVFAKYPFLRPINDEMKRLVKQNAELQVNNTALRERAQRAEARVRKLEGLPAAGAKGA